MSRFIECGCRRLVNVDSIARVEAGVKRNDDCTVITKDGQYLRAPYYVYDEVAGKDHIVQLIPTNGRYQTYYRDNDGENGGDPWVYDFDYFAVCANGEVRPLECADGYLGFADTTSDYEGIEFKEEK